MFDDFDLMIQPEELFDEDISSINLILEDENGEETEYSIEIDGAEDLEELFATHLLNMIAEDLEELTDLEEQEDVEIISDDIDWEYELNNAYDLDDEDISEISRDFFDMLNED